MIQSRSIHTLFRCLVLGLVFVPGLALPLDLTINDQASLWRKISPDSSKSVCIMGIDQN